MIRRLLLIAIVVAIASPVEARHHHHHRSRVPWCGLYMMQLKGKQDPRLARAAEWARIGFAAGGPAIGAVVVWPHHVGEILGGPDRAGRYLVHSGNDGNAVRTRWRRVDGAIAFRFVQ
jgi:hypothetical protein